MKLLLDTHAFIWATEDDQQLSGRAAKAIALSSNEVFVSAVCAWEIAIKVSLKKLQLSVPLEERMRGMAAAGYQHLPVDWSHAAATAELPFHHKDPFDRMLAAQARVEGMTLVSRDPVFKKFGIKTLW